jgi:hypothetical protein
VFDSCPVGRIPQGPEFRKLNPLLTEGLVSRDAETATLLINTNVNVKLEREKIKWLRVLETKRAVVGLLMAEPRTLD